MNKSVYSEKSWDEREKRQCLKLLAVRGMWYREEVITLIKSIKF